MLDEYIQGLLPSTLPVFIGDLPSQRTNSVSLIRFEGNPNTEFFGEATGCTIFEPIYKFVVRHSDYAEGDKWVKQIKDTLHRYHDDTLLSVLAIGDSMYLGRSAEKLHEFQITFRINVKE